MCTGACLAPAAQHWGEWGLGPTPHDPPAAGLAPGAPVAPQPPRIRPPLPRLREAFPRGELESTAPQGRNRGDEASPRRFDPF